MIVVMNAPHPKDYYSKAHNIALESSTVCCDEIYAAIQNHFGLDASAGKPSAYMIHVIENAWIRHQTGFIKDNFIKFPNIDFGFQNQKFNVEIDPSDWPWKHIDTPETVTYTINVSAGILWHKQTSYLNLFKMFTMDIYKMLLWPKGKAP